MSSEIIIYQSEDGLTRIQTRLENETVWLTQEQMAELFGKGRSTITEHISNIYKEGELEPEATRRNFRQVQTEGTRTVERAIEHYNSRCHYFRWIPREKHSRNALSLHFSPRTY